MLANLLNRNKQHKTKTQHASKIYFCTISHAQALTCARNIAQQAFGLVSRPRRTLICFSFLSKEARKRPPRGVQLANENLAISTVSVLVSNVYQSEFPVMWRDAGEPAGRHDVPLVNQLTLD